MYLVSRGNNQSGWKLPDVDGVLGRTVVSGFGGRFLPGVLRILSEGLGLLVLVLESVSLW